jgi:hypothetical protein
MYILRNLEKFSDKMSSPFLIATLDMFLWAMSDFLIHEISVADLDPYVFGPPGSRSGSIRQRYGSGSFYYQAKIVRKKTLIHTVLWLVLNFLSLKNDVNVPSKSDSRKTSRKTFLTVSFMLASWRSVTKIAGSGFISQRHGSPDPNPHQYGMDTATLQEIIVMKVGDF